MGSTRWTRHWAGSSSSSACSTGSTSATRTSSSTWSIAAAAHTARPAVITFDHHPDEVLIGHAPPLLLDPDERLERLEAAGVDVTVVQTFRCRAPRATPFDVVRPAGSPTGRADRLPDDARLPPSATSAADAGGRRVARRARRVRGRGRPAVHARRADVRSSTIRARSRPATLQGRRAARPAVRLRPLATPWTAAAGSHSSCRWPCRPTATMPPKSMASR